MSESNDELPGDVLPMPTDPGRPADVCPYLGLVDDAEAHFDLPSSEHRCRSAAAPVYVELAHQGTVCLTPRHTSCARYAEPRAGEPAIVATPPAAIGGATPESVTAGSAPSAPGADASPDAPMTTGTSYALPARAGFGALAATPSGWIPVERRAAPDPSGPGRDPAAAPTPTGLDDQVAAGVPAALGEPASAADEPATAPGGSLEPEAPADPEGLGGLVADAGPGPAADPDGLGSLVAGATAVATDAASGPPASVPSASAVDDAADGSDAAPAPAPEAAPAPGEAVEGPATLEGDAAGPGVAARLAAFGRHVVRAVAILLVAVVALAAFVGVGYVAGKLFVRPGEALSTPVPTVAPAGPTTAPGPTGLPESSPAGGTAAPATEAPGAGGATAEPAKTPKPKPTPAPTPKPRVYVVRSGDTLFGISARFGVPVDVIIKVNKIADPNAIYPGQRLVIPRP